MSRAFVKEDSPPPRRRQYHLPPREDPEFDGAAARALLEAARIGETESAEEATGYRWGEPRLLDAVRAIRDEAELAGDERLEQLARRFVGRG